MGTPFLIYVHAFTAVLGSADADVLAQSVIDHYRDEDGASGSVDITSAKVTETFSDRSRGRNTRLHGVHRPRQGHRRCSRHGL